MSTSHSTGCMDWNVTITDDKITACVDDERLDEEDMSLGLAAEKTEPLGHWKTVGYHGDERYYEQKKDALRCLGEVLAQTDEDYEQQGIENIIESEKRLDRSAAKRRHKRRSPHPNEELQF